MSKNELNVQLSPIPGGSSGGVVSVSVPPPIQLQPPLHLFLDSLAFKYIMFKYIYTQIYSKL